jgi:transcriptional regulator with XRE-family HTH domain
VGDARRGANDDGEAFGPRLRRLRLAAGLAQADLAGERVSASYISLLESGRRTPTPPVLAHLAARLGVPTDELDDAAAGLTATLVLAESATGLGRPADAVVLLEPLADRLVPERLGADPLLFRAGVAYAAALESSARLDDATVVLERLCAAVELSPARLPMLPVVIALTRCYRDAGDVSRAIDVGERALDRLQGYRLGDVEGFAALVSTVAGAYHERGDLLRAAQLLDDLLRRADAEGSSADRAAAYWNAALLAVDRGRAGEGLRLVEQATALLSDAADERWRARIQVTRSWVLLAQDPPAAAEARDVLRRSLPAIRQHAGAASLGSAETNLARCELLLGRPEVARRHARSALRILEPESRLERARALTALGAASVALGETAAGVESLELAAEQLAGAEAPRQAAAVWRMLSEVYLSLGDPARALDAADRALDAAGVPREPLVPTVSAAAPSAARARRSRPVPSPASGPAAGRR